MTLIAPSHPAMLTWPEPPLRVGAQALLGASPTMQALRRLLCQMAPYDVPVLLEGEESTGKQLAATVIHSLSPYRDGPFVTVDCEAFSEAMLGVELFGCEPGLYVRYGQGLPGKVEWAQGGTLFVRHLERLPTWAQIRLLQTLETRTVMRLGANEGVPVNIRLITAITSCDAPAPRGATPPLRTDLRERLGGEFVVHMPPLRACRRDILLLSRHFLKDVNRTTGREVKGFSKDATAVLERYPWPGNLRELRQCIHSAAGEAGSYVTADHLPRHVRAGAAPVLAPPRLGLHRTGRRARPSPPRGH